MLKINKGYLKPHIYQVFFVNRDLDSCYILLTDTHKKTSEDLLKDN